MCSIEGQFVDIGTSLDDWKIAPSFQDVSKSSDFFIDSEEIVEDPRG